MDMVFICIYDIYFLAFYRQKEKSVTGIAFKFLYTYHASLHAQGLHHLTYKRTSTIHKSHCILLVMSFSFKLINVRNITFLTISENELSLADIPMTGME